MQSCKLWSVIGVIAFLAANPATVAAADLYWDGGAANIPGSGDGVSQGGAGTWNNTISNWDAGAGLAHVAWNSTNAAVFGGAGGVVTLGAAITNAGLLLTGTNDVTIAGAFGFVINGAVNLAGTNNLTLGNASGGTVNLSAATLSGSTVLTWNKTADSYFTTIDATLTGIGAFNSSNAVNFTGTLRLRGSTPSTAPGSMQGGTGRFWLHSSAGSQAPGTAFFLDTGAAANNGQDFIIGDWNTNGNRTLTLSGLTGFGTIRTDAGFNGTRNLIVNQSANTTFNGMILSHKNVNGNDRPLALTKDGAGSLTLAGIIGIQTTAAGGNTTPLSVTVLNGTLVMSAANTLTGPTTVNGGALVINGIHPATSPITVADAGTLSGTGVINSAVTNNGTLAPGNGGIGTLTFGTSVNLTGTALMEISADGGLSKDVVTTSSTLNYGGTLTVTNIGVTALTLGNSFKLFNAASYNGSFAATNLPSLASGLDWLWTPGNGTLTVVPAGTVVAADLFWDGGAANIVGNGDGVSQGGSGTWNNTLANWDQGNGLPHTSWSTTANAIFGGAGGVASLGSAITCGGILNAAISDVTLAGAFGLTIKGTLDVGSLHNLTLGDADGGMVNLSDATLTGSTVLTWNKTADSYVSPYGSISVGAFNSSNAVNFTGTLRLRGSTPSAAPNLMQDDTGRFWLHSTLGSQVTNTAFFLDTGAATNNGSDFIIGDWNINGNRTLTLSGLTGFGTVRTDAGITGTRNLIVNQAINTTFNGMILSHYSSPNNRSLAFTKDGVGSLTLAGIVGYQTTNSSGGNFSGSTPLSVTVLNGTLVLGAVNTLTGPTTVTGGTLAINGIHPATSPITVTAAGTLSGTGVINSAVTNNGTLAPGNGGIGTLTFGTSVNLAGTALMEISADGGLNNDVVATGSTLNYGGTLTVTNIGVTALTLGNSFKLFNATSYNGSFTATNLPLLNPGLGWSWTPTNGTLTVVQSVNPTPTNFIATVSGNQLTLTWPSDHTGWTLQTQTNALSAGLSTNAWYPVAGSAATNSVTVTIDPAQPTVFYRMTWP